ncbi:hypothetical protein D3C80_1581800 [compost metagenome]
MVSRLPKVVMVILLIDAPRVLYSGWAMFTVPVSEFFSNTSTLSGLLSEIRNGE